MSCLRYRAPSRRRAIGTPVAVGTLLVAGFPGVSVVGSSPASAAPSPPPQAWPVAGTGSLVLDEISCGSPSTCMANSNQGLMVTEDEGTTWTRHRPGLPRARQPRCHRLRDLLCLLRHLGRRSHMGAGAHSGAGRLAGRRFVHHRLEVPGHREPPGSRLGHLRAPVHVGRGGQLGSPQLVDLHTVTLTTPFPGESPLFVSGDGGTTWLNLPLPSGVAATEVTGGTWTDAWDCFMVGVHSGTSTAFVEDTSDAGGTWTGQDLGSGITNFDSVACPAKSTCLVTAAALAGGASLLVWQRRSRRPAPSA